MPESAVRALGRKEGARKGDEDGMRALEVELPAMGASSRAHPASLWI